MNQPILPDHSSIHWTNSTVLCEGELDPKPPESYLSIILLFSGVILARIAQNQWIPQAQLLQENIPEAEPQEFGMLVFISLLSVTMGHVPYFFYAR
ncbi:hypothetical protein GH733_013344, partial [Mirounga leonina]